MSFPETVYIEQYKVYHQLKSIKRKYHCSMDESFIYWQIGNCYQAISKIITLFSSDSPTYHQIGQLYLQHAIRILNVIKRDWQIIKSMKKKPRGKKK